jgi:hypothetical protein
VEDVRLSSSFSAVWTLDKHLPPPCSSVAHFGPSLNQPPLRPLLHPTASSTPPPRTDRASTSSALPSTPAPPPAPDRRAPLPAIPRIACSPPASPPPASPASPPPAPRRAAPPTQSATHRSARAPALPSPGPALEPLSIHRFSSFPPLQYSVLIRPAPAPRNSAFLVIRVDPCLSVARNLEFLQKTRSQHLSN